MPLQRRGRFVRLTEAEIKFLVSEYRTAHGARISSCLHDAWRRRLALDNSLPRVYFDRQ